VPSLFVRTAWLHNTVISSFSYTGLGMCVFVCVCVCTIVSHFNG
jgi:hypothetical protein